MKIRAVHAAVFVAFMGAVTAFGETYTWVDDQGTVNFSEDLGSVPPKFRKRVRLLDDMQPPPDEGAREGGKAPVAGAAGEEPAGRGEEKAPAREKAKEKPKEKELYAGRDGETWKQEYGALKADLKGAERQLVRYREHLKDPSILSRDEYLSIEHSIRLQEKIVLDLRKRVEDFKGEAAAAGVPAGVLE